MFNPIDSEFLFRQSLITSPPEVAVEVLVPEDRAADVQGKIDDYLQFGISAVWLIDPERQRAWIHTKEGAHEAADRVLRNPAGDLEVPLSAVFPNPAYAVARDLALR
jgi:Uma2 family endonuclease